MKYFILNSSGNYESLFLLSKQLVSWQLFYVCLFRLNLTFGDFLCHFSVSLSLIFDGGCGGGTRHRRSKVHSPAGHADILEVRERES